MISKSALPQLVGSSRVPGVADMIAALPVAMLVVGPDNIVMDVNARAETLLNMARSAIVGSDIARTIRVDKMDQRIDLWQSDKPLAAYDITIHAGRNAAVRADLMISPLAEHDGWRVITIHTQSLAQAIGGRRTSGGARSAMGAAAILAHEIKNPLSGIRGAAQLLDTGSSDSNRALTSLICNEVDRIAALIDGMQDFTTERQLDCVPANIYPMLDRAINIATAGFASDVKIVRKYDPSLPDALCNADAVVQIVINLLKNAAEALEGREDREIRIETAFRHGVSVVLGEGKGNAILPIEILVIDNGPGVPPNIQDHLFNPFISSKRGSQGLGLALVDKLVRDMNGFVQYARDEDEGDSVFRVLLPMGQGR
ncbi:MAG: nitrogen regulation protein NR(II) [Sphingobium sp.]